MFRLVKSEMKESYDNLDVKRQKTNREQENNVFRVVKSEVKQEFKILNAKLKEEKREYNSYLSNLMKRERKQIETLRKKFQNKISKEVKGILQRQEGIEENLRKLTAEQEHIQSKEKIFSKVPEQEIKQVEEPSNKRILSNGIGSSHAEKNKADSENESSQNTTVTSNEGSSEADLEDVRSQNTAAASNEGSSETDLEDVRSVSISYSLK
ncbi:protein PXR1-like isoform X3 [Centruroides sculpturatus]|uniref:protein PXR1-like isoform X3 n=1 Tax=Centruroides sculpturatus TaxID=218467 RepID=UPI000C6DBC66|nr:protein PXR1-like isoform X3 [Centruroides sculpturatus]